MPLPTPHKIILSIIPVFLMIGILFRHGTIDIQYHDTYIVFSAFHLSFIFSGILMMIGIVYWQYRNRKLISWLTFFHVGWTVLIFGFLLISAAFRFSGISMVLGFLLDWGIILIFFTGIVQLLLLINVRRSKVQ